ncbi:MAG: ATPase P [Candidatus Delongbacteria bacterium]|nr:ATPase P [Candidatus Delongbacteria bacterium]
MITFEIPGERVINAEHLVLDYNGTLAADGVLLPGVAEKLNQLSSLISIHVITADTYGGAAEKMAGVNCDIIIIEDHYQTEHKKEYVKRLGADNVIAIGNGANDASMVKNAALGISVIQAEGASPSTIFNSNIVCTNILDALDLLFNPTRVSATLRV